MTPFGVARPLVVDLFAGPGGWDVAARELGIDVVGIEIDDAACATREAAGLTTVQADVSTFPLVDVTIDGLIASPPCQTFSTAGKGAGRKALDAVLACIDVIARDTATTLPPFADERTGLVLQPLLWVRRYLPRWVAFEQVPPVLPVWQAMADVLERWGYFVATGTLSAEQYGVPQTRKRAILLASRDHYVELPAPTHRKYRKGVAQDEGDPALLPWVSMAEALGWTSSLVGFPRRADGRAAVEIDGVDYRERDLRPDDEPVFALTEKARSWERFIVAAGVTGEGRPRPAPAPAPAPTMTGKGTAYVVELPAERINDQSGSGDDGSWAAERPATTLATRDLVGSPGANANRFNGATKSRNDGVRVTVAEAGVLQSFPADYPWQGTKTKQYQQVGNAIPPLLAAHVLAEVVGISVAAAPAIVPAQREAVGDTLANNNTANACVRPITEPAGTIYFGHRANAVEWQRRNNSGPGAERDPRPVTEPSYTIRANGSGSHPSGVEWISDELPLFGTAADPVDEPLFGVAREPAVCQCPHRDDCPEWGAA